MRSSKPYLIAEIGVNYYDSAKELGITPFEAAKLYVKSVKDSGADCAKFQSYKAETIVSKNSPAYWDTKKEPTKTQFELFKKFDSFGEKEYEELSKYAHSIGLDFTSTPFDYNSADYLEKLVDFYKISSSDLSNLPFIKHIARKKKPIVISVGASTIDEIKKAIGVIKNEGVKDITILHCVLSYPTLNQNANLKIIKTLKEAFPDVKVGYSDHVMPDKTMTVLSTAYLLGAEVIEKHFTLNKKLVGNDHYHAGDINDFKMAVSNFELINTILGSGKKEVLECEKISRREARRSLFLTRNMKKGEIITEKDIIAKRPGYGISPEFTDKVIGKKLNRDVKEDSALLWDYI